ncbi:MAG: RNA methyltransferase, partial [Alphaproteobacteria bacterium]|nr:RNA methyltransferase [Alphaproteobacteria bacterium]
MTAVKIDRLGIKGDGLGRVGDTQIFATKVLPGETIDWMHGKVKSILEPSPDRQLAFCQHFDRCGGCKFQNWKHEPYALWKRQLVVDALKAQGLDTKVNTLIDAHGEGRRRVSLHVRQVAGAWRAGFMEAKSHDLVDFDICPILVPQLITAPTIAASFGPMLGKCDVMISVADNGLDVAIKADRQAANK